MAWGTVAPIFSVYMCMYIIRDYHSEVYERMGEPGKLSEKASKRYSESPIELAPRAQLQNPHDANCRIGIKARLYILTK